MDGGAATRADIRAGFQLMLAAGSRQFVEQRLRLFQIGVSKPSVNQP